MNSREQFSNGSDKTAPDPADNEQERLMQSEAVRAEFARELPKLCPN